MAAQAAGTDWSTANHTGSEAAHGRRFECNSTYEVHAKDRRAVRDGGWYYGFDCRACNRRFAVFEDASAGKNPTLIEGGGSFRVRCPHCDENGFYSTAEIRHYQATD